MKTIALDQFVLFMSTTEKGKQQLIKNVVMEILTNRNNVALVDFRKSYMDLIPRFKALSIPHHEIPKIKSRNPFLHIHYNRDVVARNENVSFEHFPELARYVDYLVIDYAQLLQAYQYNSFKLWHLLYEQNPNIHLFLAQPPIQQLATKYEPLYQKLTEYKLLYPLNSCSDDFSNNSGHLKSFILKTKIGEWIAMNKF